MHIYFVIQIEVKGQFSEIRFLLLPWNLGIQLRSAGSAESIFALSPICLNYPIYDDVMLRQCQQRYFLVSPKLLFHGVMFQEMSKVFFFFFLVKEIW